MQLPGLYWPLESNFIRRGSSSNAFGMVRNGGKRAHQGWDLLAYPGTRCYAIADSEVVSVRADGDYGKQITIRFMFRGRVLYATYAHLSMYVVRRSQKLLRGEWIGLTGNTGNAGSMEGVDQHLHFEIRTVIQPGHGLNGRVDPKDIYGAVPLRTTYYDTRPLLADRRVMSAPGLKIPGLNVL